MSLAFERVAGPYEFTEGPVWDGETVRFTDIPNGRIYAYDPATGDCEVWREGTERGNGLALGPDGELYGCEMGGRRVVCYRADGSTTVVAAAYEGDRLNSPNDLAFDREGRLWFTDPDYDEREPEELALDHRSVYRCEPRDEDWSVERMTTDTTNPNGLALSPDESTLYVAQSEFGEGKPRELRAYPVAADEGGPSGARGGSSDEQRESDGALGECRVLHDFGPHRGVDGMCLDEDGNVVATAGWEESGPGPLLYVFTPAGRVLETHPYPGPAPTNCCFAGEDLTTLYVTGYDGGLWRAETDRRGLALPGP